MGIYLPLDEPLPSTVRHVNVSKFNYFFGQDKTFRVGFQLILSLAPGLYDPPL